MTGFRFWVFVFPFVLIAILISPETKQKTPNRGQTGSRVWNSGISAGKPLANSDYLAVTLREVYVKGKKCV